MQPISTNWQMNKLYLGNIGVALNYASWEAFVDGFRDLKDKYNYEVEGDNLIIKKAWEKSGSPRFFGRIFRENEGVVINGIFKVPLLGLLLLLLWYVALLAVTGLCLAHVLNPKFLQYLSIGWLLSLGIHGLNRWGSIRAAKKMIKDLKRTEASYQN